MHGDHVEHKGVVSDVTFNSIVIAVDEPCQCEGCAIALVCSGKSPQSETTIVIPRRGHEGFAKGERVSVEASEGARWRAILWAFVLPTIILVAAVVTLTTLYPDLGIWTAFIAVVQVSIYELILYIFRKDLAMSVDWQIRHC